MKIKDLTKVGNADGLEAIVSERAVREKKNGDQYFTGKLLDNTGVVNFTCWSIELFNTFQTGNAVILSNSSMGEYNGDLQMTVKTASVIPVSRAEAAGIIPVSPMTLVQLDDYFESIVKIMTDKIPDIAVGINKMQADGTLDKFKLYPAAMRIHQAYLRGLYEHSISVTRLASRCMGVYDERAGVNNMNGTILLLGALFHDIGKIWEYEMGPLGLVSDVSVIGGLSGHHFLGAEYLKKIFYDILTPIELNKLIHIILAHHGRKEWGSPVEPRIMEAFIVHHCDMIDGAFERYTEVQSEDRWIWNKGNDTILNPIV